MKTKIQLLKQCRNERYQKQQQEALFDNLNCDKAVCRKCKYAMTNYEPGSPLGEFYHPTKDLKGNAIVCKNSGKIFNIHNLEVEPFMRKRDRRRNFRNKKFSNANR